MIVPMKKVSLIIRGDRKEETLNKLRSLGILHIEILEGRGKKLEELKEKISLLERTVFLLEEKKPKDTKPREATVQEAISIAEKVQALAEERKECSAEHAALTAEIERFADWGDIDPESLAELSREGIELSFYETSKSEYETLGDSVKTLPLAETKASVKFMIIKTGAEGEEEVLAALNKFQLVMPRESTGKLKEKQAALARRLEEIDGAAASDACYIDSMKKAVRACEKDVEFEVYRTGMEDETLSADGKSEVSIAYFTGYVEAENVDRIKTAAKDNSWGLLVEEPTEEDNVPTKLKNNRFVSLIYPLTDFLGTVPGYFEYDISGWFLGFILIFFGIIFGDGGYGLLILAIALVPIIKAYKAKKPVSPAFLLMALMGLTTILWGTLTCSWFGITPERLPGWLRSLSIPVISSVYADKIWYPFWMTEQMGDGLTKEQNVQIFCFTLALVQLSAAHVLAAIRHRKTLKAIGDIGSLMQLIGMFYVVLSLVVNANVFSFGLVIAGIPIGLVAVVFVAVGFVLNFVFGNYEGSIVKSIVASLADIVSMLLGVVNVFADIVSYIRLWAVALAGSAISATVNELAGPLFGRFVFILFAIFILVFGHGLNMILNVLSVIVHGIRLNTLEFSSHLDMSWSGHKFQPFKKEISL
ncbi:V-type ATP synthase subunit I [Candidatus Bariatricus faecipullorum]